MTEQQMFRLIETKTTPIKILKSQKKRRQDSSFLILNLRFSSSIGHLNINRNNYKATLFDHYK